MHSNERYNTSNCSSRLAWILVVILGLLLIINYFGIPGIETPISAPGISWLSWLLSLACPLMMILMMVGCFRGHNHNSGDKGSQAGDSQFDCCGRPQSKQSAN